MKFLFQVTKEIYILLWLGLFLLLFSPANGKRALEDPITGEKAMIAITALVGPTERPLAVIFPSGYCLWTNEFFEKERIPLYNSYLSDGQKLKLEDDREKRLLEILNEQLDSGKSVEDAVNLAMNDMELKEIAKLKNTVAYSSGYIDSQSLESLKHKIYRSGALKKDDNKSSFGGNIQVQFCTDGYFFDLNGPLVFPQVDFDDSFKWDENLELDENWTSFISLIFSACVNSDYVGREDIFLEKKEVDRFEGKRVVLSGDIDEVESQQLMSKSAKTDQALEKASDLAKFDTSAACLSLRKSLPDIPEGEKHYAVRQLGYYCIKDQETAKAYDSFASLALGEFPATDKVVAESTLRAGYLSLKMKNENQALSYFGRIATGYINVDKPVAEEATLRYAALLRKQKRAEEAIDAYQELSLNGSVAKARYATLQLAGLYFEKAKGDYESVTSVEKQDLLEQTRGVCQSLFENHDVSPEVRATAELMYLETFYYEDNYSACATLAESFEKKWSEYLEDEMDNSSWNPSRQICTAQVWNLLCLFKMKQFDQCITVCQNVNSGRWGADVPYKSFNVFAYAYLYEAFSVRELGDNERALSLFKTCSLEHPKWYRGIGKREARENELLLPELE